jgi:hypothetical protein
LESVEQLIQIENLDLSKSIPEDIQDFIQTVTQMTQLPKMKISTNKIPQSLSTHMSQKKQHEIIQITESIKKNKFKQIYDLCSGKAHLAHILTTSREENIKALDFDKDLQTSGQKLFKRYFKESKNQNLTYQHHDLLTPLSELESTQNSLLIALHACGDLSSHIITQVNPDNYIMNIGCCYHKIFKTLNISKHAQKNPLNLSFHALSLANKSNQYATRESWERRFKVKSYRYALHMIDYHHNLELKNINQIHFSHYEKTFSQYAQLLTHKNLDFNKLYKEHSESSIMKNYLKLEALRLPLGRIIELLIILDRALYLQEKGHKPQIVEFFDRRISPRNIALFNF